MTQEQVDQYIAFQSEKSELEVELRRIDAFLARDPQNEDNGRAINAGKIFTKFAGTACMLPVGVFTGALNARKAEVNQRLSDIETELSAV